jgi:excisionase family DNA binding protein
MTQAAATIAPLAVGPEEAGRMTGHTRSAVYEAIAKGDLESFKSGKRRLILVKQLEAWLNRLAKENAR